jgi:hypothetical protein
VFRSLWARVAAVSVCVRYTGACIVAAALCGCGGGGTVTRVAGAQVAEGRFIDEDAYAAVLRGAIAEAGGRYAEAVLAYEAAGRADEADPLVLRRLGASRCAADPSDARADRAFARADELTGAAASTALERAWCAGRRGQAEQRRQWLTQARALGADAAETGLDDSMDAAAAVAASMESGARNDALWAVFDWALARHRADVALYAALGAAQGPVAPQVRGEAAVVAFEDRGDPGLAARLAMALAKRKEPLGAHTRRLVFDETARGEPAAADVLPLLARLHMDEPTAAARAMLLGSHRLAQDMLARRLEAEPTLGPACGVALAQGMAPAAACDGGRGIWSAEAWLVTARALLSLGGVQAADAFARGIAPPSIDERDPLVLGAAVELALRGVSVRLPPGGLLRLSLLRDDGLAPPSDTGMTPSHARLFHACRGEGDSLGAEATREPVLHAAALCLAVARRQNADPWLLTPSPHALVRAMQKKYNATVGR